MNSTYSDIYKKTQNICLITLAFFSLRKKMAYEIIMLCLCTSVCSLLHCRNRHAYFYIIFHVTRGNPNIVFCNFLRSILTKGRKRDVVKWERYQRQFIWCTETMCAN
jgi:hypothetical protein